jgi:4-amino-4-deoxy-L-arabinose transferase-like glycosyltransferase
LQPSTLAKRGTLFLFLVVIGFYFYGLGHFPLLGPDEPRYAQVAREMFLRRDFVTPTLGGHVWFEKPALLYWMMMASYKLFGVSEWAARFPAALSGVLTVTAVFFIGRKAEQTYSAGRLAAYSFWSALATATSLGIIVFSRAASFDIILTMTITWALAFFIIYEFEENSSVRRRCLVGFYAFIGLALLAKGLVGLVIPVGVVGLYYLFRRRLPDRDALMSLFWGIPLALAVAAIWYAPVIWKHGWLFVDQFFVQQHFARYVTNKYRHPGPLYYYLIVIPLLALPWSVFLIEGIVSIRTWRWRLDDPLIDPINKLRLFVLAWLAVPLVFFSFSGSKLPGYILPVLPAVALMVGERLSRDKSDAGNSNWAIRATAAMFVVSASLTVAYASRTGNLPLRLALMIAVPLCVAGGFALLSTRWRPASILLIAGATLVVVLSVLIYAAPAFAELESTKHLIQLADARGYSKAAIYGLERGDRTPEFYAAGRLVYGADGEPILYEGPSQVIDESYTRGETFLVFVPLQELDQLTGSKSVQTDLLGTNGRVALVAVRAR